jgi:hypothetical protein
MGVDLYRVVLTLFSPTIVSAKGSERGLLYTITKEIIPGPTFHGALIKSLTLNVYPGSNVESSALQTFATPLYPVTTRDSKLYNDVTVAHALSIHGKGRASAIVTSYSIEKVLALLEQGSELEEAIAKSISEYLEVLYSESLKLGAGLSINIADLKSTQGVAVEKIGIGGVDVWSKVKVRKGVYLENAVDRVRGAVRAGAFYGYEYIAPGTVFTGYVACLSGQGLCKDLPTINGVDILVGKGQGRGFGRARIEVKQVKVEDIVKVCCPLDEKLVALISTSPSLVADPIPRPIRVGDVLETVSGAKLVVKHVIGSRVDVYTGWSRLRHSPRLVIRGNAVGVILIAEVVDDKLSESLCLELMLGMIRNSLPGFNTFQVVKKDPLYISPDTFVKIVKSLG